MFQPHLFIGIGQNNHYFTLRESYLHHYKGAAGTPCTELRSFHHFNLSQNPDEAIAKATEAAERMGLPLHTTRAQITAQLEEIKRATAAEAKAAQDREAQWKAEREEREAANLARWHEQIAEGFFPDCFRNVTVTQSVPNRWHQEFGETIELGAIRDAGVGYLNWLMDKMEAGEFEPDSLIALVAQKALETCHHLRLPRPDPDRHTGVVGKRETFEVTITRVFRFEGFYGVTHFVTMVDKTGCCLLSKGKFNAEVGEMMKIKATVKEHDHYKGQAQTVVQRVALA